MISTIRDNMGSKALKLVLWGALIAIPGGTLFVGLTDRSSGPAGAVATVNGYSIMGKDLKMKAYTIERRIQAIKAQFGAFADGLLQSFGMIGSPLDIALRELVQEKLLLDVADKSGLTTLSPEYVYQKLSDPTFAMQYLSEIVPRELYGPLGKFDEKLLVEFLRRQGITIDSFEDQLEETLKQLFVMKLVQIGSYTSKIAQKRMLSESESTREFAVATLNLSDYVKKAVAEGATDKELKDFFVSQNKSFKRYWVPEKRSGRSWSFTPDSYGIKVSDKDVKVFFARNKDHFGDKKLESVRKEIEETIKLNKFKQRFSTDARQLMKNVTGISDFVAKHKGSTTQTIKNEVRKSDSAVIQKLFDIKKAGFTIKGNEGLIVLLDGSEKSYQPKFEDVRKDVEKDFLQERAVKNMGKDAAELQKAALNGNLKEAAQKFNARVLSKTIKGSDSSAWEKAGKDKLPVERMKKMSHEGYAIKHLSPQGATVIELVSIVEPQALGDSVASTKETSAEQLFIPAFIASLQNNATIVYSDPQAKA